MTPPPSPVRIVQRRARSGETTRATVWRMVGADSAKTRAAPRQLLQEARRTVRHMGGQALPGGLLQASTRAPSILLRLTVHTI
jgi:hypothetical protein